MTLGSTVELKTYSGVSGSPDAATSGDEAEQLSMSSVSCIKRFNYLRMHLGNASLRVVDLTIMVLVTVKAQRVPSN
jgi:hypothetical protein